MGKKIKGVNHHRLKDNPEEKRFADAWEKHNEQGKTLAYLMDPNNRGDYPCSPRELTVAATVMQWLGSPVGQHFLEDLGYVKKEPGDRHAGDTGRGWDREIG